MKSNIIVIGIGGIGGCLIPDLLKFLNSHHPRTTVTFVDGDEFTDDNRGRQLVFQLANKARVVKEHFEGQYPNIRLTCIESFVTEETIAEIISEDAIIFLCVDNHATRKLVSDYCEDMENVIVFSGGNELKDGNMQIFMRENGVNKSFPIANHLHREIQFPTDRNPAELGCQDLQERVRQLLATNRSIATVMFNAFTAYAEGELLVEGKLRYDEVYIDIITNNSRSYRNFPD